MRITGLMGSYLNGITEQWLLVAPKANPAILEMFRDREASPLRQMVPWAGEFAGNTNDAIAFPTIVETMESRFGTVRRVWVLDGGIASKENLDFPRDPNQSFLVGTPRSRLSEFDAEHGTRHWRRVRPQVEV